MLVTLDQPMQLPQQALLPEVLKSAPYPSLTSEAPRAPEKVRFVPFYRVQDEVYTTYVERI
jgi:hypothetical protein